MKYRKKPVVVEAVRWTNKNFKEIRLFIGYHVFHRDNKLFINTSEGVMHAETGDYIIKGVNGEYYPCNPDVFAKTYERVAE